ncbi:hypothetical protein [Chlorogloea sp. CCALA 695]|nr:hypothetical protein [Chlorogloea sp. CCALA 695]
MPQSDRFIDNLIEMRSHYTKQIQQRLRTTSVAQDSLVHVNGSISVLQ